MIRPRNETDDLFISLIKNCGKPIKHTHKMPEETLELQLKQTRESFPFKQSFYLGFDSKWIAGLTKFEVYKSLYNITEENIKFELYTVTFDEFSFTESEDKLEGFLDISNNHPSFYRIKQ